MLSRRARPNLNCLPYTTFKTASAWRRKAHAAMVEFPYMFMIATIGLMLGIVWTLLWSGAVFGNLVARLLTWFMLPPDEELRIGSIGFATLGGQVPCLCVCV